MRRLEFTRRSDRPGRARGMVWVAALVLTSAVSLPGADASPSESVPPDRPVRWLAAGDSYSAGEGLPIVDDGEEQCQRAQNGVAGTAKAWAPTALDFLGDDGLEVAEFRFTACTGATTSDFFSGADGRPTQWDGATRYDLVTFSFGGNDMGFSRILYQCLGLSVEGAAAAVSGGPVTAAASWRTRAGCPPEDDMRNAVDGINDPDRDGETYQELLTRVAEDATNQGGNVVVVGYPNLIEDPQFWSNYTWFGLATCQGIRREDALALRGVAGHLNATIGQAVADVDRDRPNGVRFTFVDINTGATDAPDGYAEMGDSALYEPSEGPRHAICSSEPWLNGITLRPRPMRSFHPTADGQRAAGALVARRIESLDWSRLIPDPANTTYPAGACGSDAPLPVRGGESANAGEGALPDGSDNPQAISVEAARTGRLDTDGDVDLAAVLTCTRGGATGFLDGWVWLSESRQWRPVPRVVPPDGDAWLTPSRTFGVDMRDGLLVVSDEIVQGASGDEAMCCAGTTVEAVWRLDGEEFTLEATPTVQGESANPLNAFLVGTSLGFDTSLIATPEAIAQAEGLGLEGAEITDSSTCDEGDTTIYCAYPMRRQDGQFLTIEVFWGPPDADFEGADVYSASEPPIVTSVRSI